MVDDLTYGRGGDQDQDPNSPHEVSAAEDRHGDPKKAGVFPPPLSALGQFTGAPLALAALRATRDKVKRASERSEETASQSPIGVPVMRPSAYVAPPPTAPHADNSVTLPRANESLVSEPYRVARRKKTRTGRSFLAFVCVPTLLVGCYYGFIAKKQYTSEFRFSVIEQTTALPSSAQQPSNSMSGGGISASLSTVSAALTGASSQGNGAVQNFMVVDYVTSPAAVDAMQKKIDLAKLLAKGDNPFARFPSNPTAEELSEEWQKVVSSYYDPISSLAYVKINAFTPQDSLLIANTLMSLSEDLVNKIANRANEDAVKFAQNEVVRTKARVADAAKLMQEYRNGDQVIDPTSSVVAANIALLTTLRQNVVSLQTQVDSLMGQHFNATSPTVKNLSAQLKAAKDQLRDVENEVKSARDGNKALSSVVGRYETLDLTRQYANLAYTNAMLALDQTRANAAAQHIYLTPYSEPILPAAAAGPQVVSSTLLAFLIIAAAWLVLLLVLRSINEARV